MMDNYDNTISSSNDTNPLQCRALSRLEKQNVITSACRDRLESCDNDDEGPACKVVRLGSNVNSSADLSSNAGQQHISSTQITQQSDCKDVSSSTVTSTKPITTELCLVCCDDNAAFHCGAVVCEACKKFFIRYLKLGTERLHCNYSQSCVLTKKRRTNCQYCRYKRCQELGMYKPGGKNISSQIAVLPCSVCSAQSSGFHFGAITCEGCKGFFRRTIRERDLKSYVCTMKNDLCEITFRSRNSCKSCRFRKCLAAGMTPKGSRIGRQTNSVRHNTLCEINKANSNSNKDTIDKMEDVIKIEDNKSLKQAENYSDTLSTGTRSTSLTSSLDPRLLPGFDRAPFHQPPAPSINYQATTKSLNPLPLTDTRVLPPSFTQSLPLDESSLTTRLQQLPPRLTLRQQRPVLEPQGNPLVHNSARMPHLMGTSTTGQCDDKPRIQPPPSTATVHTQSSGNLRAQSSRTSRNSVQSSCDLVRPCAILPLHPHQQRSREELTVNQVSRPTPLPAAFDTPLYIGDNARYTPRLEPDLVASQNSFALLSAPNTTPFDARLVPQHNHHHHQRNQGGFLSAVHNSDYCSRVAASSQHQTSSHHQTSRNLVIAPENLSVNNQRLPLQHKTSFNTTTTQLDTDVFSDLSRQPHTANNGKYAGSDVSQLQLSSNSSLPQSGVSTVSADVRIPCPTVNACPQIKTRQVPLDVGGCPAPTTSIVKNASNLSTVTSTSTTTTSTPANNQQASMAPKNSNDSNETKEPVDMHLFYLENCRALVKFNVSSGSFQRNSNAYFDSIIEDIISNSFIFDEKLRRQEGVSHSKITENLTPLEIWDSMMMSFTTNAKAILKYAKKIPGFKGHPMEDQIGMIQKSMFPVVLLKYSMNYCTETQKYDYFGYNQDEMLIIHKYFPPFKVLKNLMQRMGIISKLIQLDVCECSILSYLYVLMQSNDSQKDLNLLINVLVYYVFSDDSVKKKYTTNDMALCHGYDVKDSDLPELDEEYINQLRNSNQDKILRINQILSCVNNMFSYNEVHLGSVMNVQLNPTHYYNVTMPQLFEEAFIK